MNRRWLLALLAVIALVSVGAGGRVLLERRAGEPGAPPASTAGPGAAAAPFEPVAAVVDVALATLWAEPERARPVDQPALGNPVDLRRWTGSMNDVTRRALTGRAVSQMRYGDAVTVLERRGAWSRVVVPGQPSSLDGRGYPGWVPSVQLAEAGGPSTRPRVMVVKPTSALREADDTDRTVMELSYGTVLPVMTIGGPWITVARPNDGKGKVAAGDVEVQGRNRRPPAGPDLVRQAQAFGGVPFLPGGTSPATGFDGAGLVWTVYAAHGVSIPRDAHDQAAGGTPVDRARLEPGDLLFFADDGGRGRVHHVGIYTGDNQMVHAPAGRSVETVAVEAAPHNREFWGARRYLAPAAANG